MIEANSKITHLYSEAERLGKDRKNPYHHVKQLEKLKTLQVIFEECMCFIRRIEVDIFLDLFKIYCDFIIID